MKKQYVSPAMETEEFVANEYVAACFVLQCDALVYNHAGMELVYGNSINSVSGLFYANNLVRKGYYYTGTISGKSPDGLEGYPAENGRASHPVIVISGDNGVAGRNGFTDHPNASN